MQTTEAPIGVPDRRTAVIELAIALPGALVLGLATVFFVEALAGAGPLWPRIPVTLAEAAALHDDADVLRLVGQGEDVNAPGPVRAELLTHERMAMTPLEGAVGAREPQTLRLLLGHGARVDDSNWARLVCFAEHLDADEVVAILKQQLPGRAAPDCAGVAIPFEP